MSASLFPSLTSEPILRHVSTFLPGGDLLEAMIGIGQVATVRTYLEFLREKRVLERFVAPAVADLAARRDAVDLGGPVRTLERFAYLETWNRFAAAPAGTPVEDDDAAELAAPVLAMIEARLVSLVTSAKNAVGPVADHHLDHLADIAVAEVRIEKAEAALKAALASGTATSIDYGAPTARERDGLARVILRDGLPVIQTLRVDAKRAWRDAKLVDERA